MPTNESPLKVAPEEFLRNLAESGIAGAAALSRRTFEAAPAAIDGAALAELFVAVGALTQFQANAVLQRRFADLRMGNYDILDLLGTGGMGTVFKARHRRMKRIVALKLVAKEFAETNRFAERFQREVETIARLIHPNIVMAYDADEADRGPFLVMEFVDGQDLGSLVESNGPMALTEGIDCVIQAARGLAYAHAQGIVHRDIKPANLLRDKAGIVKVADLGLALLTVNEGEAIGRTSLTQSGIVVGTVDYMSPEQTVDSGEIDHRSDIYSLGCSLHYLLTTNAPYRGSSFMAVMLKHQAAPIPSLCKARPDATAELDSVFHKMVAKDPNQRYQSMSDAAAALEQAHSRLNAGTGPVAKRAAPPAASTEASGRTVVDAPGAATQNEDFDFELEATAPLARLVVVLVEPSRAQTGIIRRLLEQLGIAAIHTADSGKSAIATAKARHARLIVSSMYLPDMTGAQLAKAMLEDPACGSIGFILATSESDIDHISSLPASPRVITVAKPFDLKRLGRSIELVTG